MNQTGLSSTRGDESIELFELSVVLATARNSNNPAILNPDFLYEMEIVDREYEVQDDPISTPAYSRVAFNSGIEVTSTVDRVEFKQSGNLQQINEIVLPVIAKKYAKTIPYPPIFAVGVNPKSFLQGAASNQVLNMLRETGSWTEYKDTTPSASLKVDYRFSERRIVLEILHGQLSRSNESLDGVIFNANIHRDIKAKTSESRINQICSTLDSWQVDLNDCRELIRKYSSK